MIVSWKRDNFFNYKINKILNFPTLQFHIKPPFFLLFSCKKNLFQVTRSQNENIDRDILLFPSLLSYILLQFFKLNSAWALDRVYFASQCKVSSRFPVDFCAIRIEKRFQEHFLQFISQEIVVKNILYLCKNVFLEDMCSPVSLSGRAGHWCEVNYAICLTLEKIHRTC